MSTVFVQITWFFVVEIQQPVLNKTVPLIIRGPYTKQDLPRNEQSFIINHLFF